jgi:hypothetical protein
MESQATSSSTAPPPEPAPNVAEDLPEIYRAILDRVAGLERIGARPEAAAIRAAATRAYSDAWDDRARRQLVGLLVRAQRTMAAAGQRPRGWSIRRRFLPAR